MTEFTPRTVVFTEAAKRDARRKESSKKKHHVTEAQRQIVYALQSGGVLRYAPHINNPTPSNRVWMLDGVGVNGALVASLVKRNWIVPSHTEGQFSYYVIAPKLKNEPGEVWKPVPGYGRFEISNKARIRSVMTPQGKPCLRYCSLRINKAGYMVAQLTNENGSKTLFVHRLIYMAFVGDIPERMEINHINGVKHDNRLENLELVTHRQNVIHAHDVLGFRPTVVQGSMNGCSKITESQVAEIRKRRASGEALAELASDYGITKANVSLIVKRKTWKHVA